MIQRLSRNHFARKAACLGCLFLLMPVSVFAADDWTFLVSPYLWFAGAKGDLSAISGAPPTTIDVSPNDALSGTEASSMLMLEASRRGHGVLVDWFYSDVLQEHQSYSASGLDWKASVQETLVTVSYTYELYREPHILIDAIGGLRYWKVGSTVTFESSTGSPRDSDVHNPDSWVDPVVGVKAKVRWADSRFYLACFLGAGAGGGADKFYDLTANIGYQVTDNLVAAIGYRLFDVDYDHNAFAYDVKQQGWMVGMVWILGTNKLALSDHSR